MILQFREQFQKLLDINDLSISKLARITNISKQTLSNWQNGGSPRDIHKVKRVADALKVSVDELLYGTKESKPLLLESLLESGRPIKGIFEIELRMVKKK